MNFRKVLALAANAAFAVWAGAALAAEPSSVADLVAKLKSSEAVAQVDLIDQLGAAGPAAGDAVAPLAELLKSKDAAVRAHAVRALGLIGAAAKSAVPALVGLLEDPDDAVRRQVISALQGIRPGPKITLPLCVNLLKNASDPGVRVRVLNTITEAGAAAAAGLIEALKNDEAAYWACIIARSIGPDAKDVAPALVARLKDPRSLVRREAILALGAIGEAAAPAAPEIAKALDDEQTRVAATFVLGELNRLPPGAEAKVLADAKSDNHLLSTISIWTIARVHPQDKSLTRHALEHLISRLNDNDPLVRQVAAQGLLSLPPAPEIALPLWEKAFKNMDEEAAGNALNAVASLGAAAVPRLTEALKHKQLRIPVAQALGRIGAPSAPATPALAKLLDDADPHVALAAAMALGNIGPGAKAAVPALVSALGAAGEAQSEAEPAIAFAIGRIGADAASAAPALEKLLKSPNQSLAVVSAWALTRVQPGAAALAKALPVLIAGLSAQAPLTRQSSAEALGEIGPAGKSAAPALRKAATDEEKSVRDAASQALLAVEKS